MKCYLKPYLFAKDSHEPIFNGSKYIRNLQKKYNIRFPLSREMHNTVHGRDTKTFRKDYKEYYAKKLIESCGINFNIINKILNGKLKFLSKVEHAYLYLCGIRIQEEIDRRNSNGIMGSG